MEAGNINDELFIIPCCASKNSGGEQINCYSSHLEGAVSRQSYGGLTESRYEVLQALSEDSQYLSDKYLKNRNIQHGPEFGGTVMSGKYLPAIERYTGSLYAGRSEIESFVKASHSNLTGPRVLILSALYGPLDPLDMIQDYNLKMPDRPAYKVWKLYFPRFLKEYVHRLSIRRVRLYLGGSTGYFKVAKLAVNGLIGSNLIDQAIQYEVINGSSYVTPFTHGQLILSHLRGQIDHELEIKVMTREL